MSATTGESSIAAAVPESKLALRQSSQFKALVNAVDAALSAIGFLRDLSCVVADYAVTSMVWNTDSKAAANARQTISFNTEGTVATSQHRAQAAWSWAIGVLPISAFPMWPGDPPHVRRWELRVRDEQRSSSTTAVTGANTVIGLGVGAADMSLIGLRGSNPLACPKSWCISTMSDRLFHSSQCQSPPRGRRDLPYGRSMAIGRYLFIADLQDDTLSVAICRNGDRAPTKDSEWIVIADANNFRGFKLADLYPYC
jgi:hypothetical protein